MAPTPVQDTLQEAAVETSGRNAKQTASAMTGRKTMFHRLMAEVYPPEWLVKVKMIE